MNPYDALNGGSDQQQRQEQQQEPIVAWYVDFLRRAERRAVAIAVDQAHMNEITTTAGIFDLKLITFQCGLVNERSELLIPR